MKVVKLFKKNLQVGGIVFSAVAVGLFLWLIYSSGGLEYFKNSPSIQGIILFEGSDCAHCDTVNTFIINNKVEDKVSFTRLEVFNSEVNFNILSVKARACGIEPSQIGVPFLWDGSRCILGYVDVIKFFRERITVKK